MTAPYPDVFAPMDDETRRFWEAAADGRLVVPRCRACATWIWYPRAICPSCGSSDVDWPEVNPIGTLYTFTVVHRAPDEWQYLVPYIIGVVELDIGVRLFTRIIVDERDVDDVRVGDRVRAMFQPAPGPGGLAGIERRSLAFVVEGVHG